MAIPQRPTSGLVDNGYRPVAVAQPISTGGGHKPVDSQNTVRTPPQGGTAVNGPKK
jgi:hypothetical protein